MTTGLAQPAVRCSAWLGDYVTTISKNSWSTGRLLLGAIIYAIKRNEPINPFLAEAYQSILRYDLKAHEKLAALPDEYVGHQKLATLLPNPHETHEGNEPPSQNGPKETPPTVVCSPCGETVSENTEGDKSPNDPSSPTADAKSQPAATALSAVGCSAWLGGDNVAFQPQIVSVSQKSLN